MPINENSKGAKVLRVIMLSYVIAMFVAGIVFGVFNLYFRDNLGAVGTAGIRGQFYEDSSR